MKLLLKVPIINDKIRASVREKMVQAFGGNFETVIIGGAGFNQEVEQFLRMSRIPLYRRLWYDRMRSDYLLRRLENL